MLKASAARAAPFNIKRDSAGTGTAKLNPHTHRSHINERKRFAAYSKTVGKRIAPVI